MANASAHDWLAQTLEKQEDKGLLESISAVYEQAGFNEEGKTLIKNACNEVIKINNQGAKLLKDGKLEESIELFMEAAKGMPDNAVINLNTAYSMIMQMQKTGRVNKYTRRAVKYLNKVHYLEPANKKYYQLMEMIQTLSSKAA